MRLFWRTERYVAHRSLATPVIKGQIMNKCHNRKLLQCAQETPDIKLEELQDIGKPTELAEKQAQQIEEHIMLTKSYEFHNEARKLFSDVWVVDEDISFFHDGVLFCLVFCNSLFNRRMFILLFFSFDLEPEVKLEMKIWLIFCVLNK